MTQMIDVVEFEVGGASYALDILIAREIVEMMPITPLPRSPSYIAGIINLRGEITNIINLNQLLGLSGQHNETGGQKIIVLMPEIAGGSHVGIIVDDVRSVIQVQEDAVERIDSSVSSESFVKGIIKRGMQHGGDGREKGEADLVIWLDIRRVLNEQVLHSP